MEKHILAVPIHLDALFVAGNTLIVEPFADFSKLPYHSDHIDYNADTPNISEMILSSPFENVNLRLEKGIHLHWSLPDALTRGGPEGTLESYPAVPNRWLITKKLKGKVHKQWIVESDYLYHNADNENNSISFPDVKLKPESEQPFYYMGRSQEIDNKWKDTNPQYLSKLTAIGYNDPTFAAFYPNCYSVFGFYDKDVKIEQLEEKENLSYQVIGWYSDPKNDLINTVLDQIKFKKTWTILQNNLTNDTVALKSFLMLLTKDLKLQFGTEDLKKLIGHLIVDHSLNDYWYRVVNTLQDDTKQIDFLINFLINSYNFNPEFEHIYKRFYKSIKEQFHKIPKVAANDSDKLKEINQSLVNYLKENIHWDFNGTEDQVPEGTYCYAQLDFKCSAAELKANEHKDKPISVSIGNTGAEALSAFLASSIGIDDSKELIEEQLECLYTCKSITGKELDLGAHFKEAQHAKSFKAEAGGHIWQIRPSFDQKDNAQNNSKEINIAMPLRIADLLDELNAQQQEVDAISADFRYKKHLLFTDWYKYMMSAYASEDDREGYPDIDLIRYFIEKQIQTAPMKRIKPSVLPELRERIAQFNKSDIPNLATFKFDKKVADFKDLLNTGTWIENLPFTAYCLQFKDKEKLQLSLQHKGGESVKAISLWVYIDTAQNVNATLLASKKRGPLLGPANVAIGSWSKIAINGRGIPSSKKLEWQHFPKDQWLHLYLECPPLDVDDELFLFANNENEGFLNGKLASLRLFSHFLAGDELMCDMNSLGHLQYELKYVPGPRFWQPTEPVVLLEGKAVIPTNRHGADGRLNKDNKLSCDLVDSDLITSYSKAALDKLSKDLEMLKPNNNTTKIGFDSWTQQPWNPFLLEWDVEVYPMKDGGNLAPENRSFEADFITRNYTLDKEEPELTPLNTNVNGAVARYRGRSILTPHAKNGLLKTIEEYFNHLKVEDCYLVHSTITDDEKLGYKTELDKWFKDKPTIEAWYGRKDDHRAAINKLNDWYQQRKVFKDGKIVDLSTLNLKPSEDFISALIQSALKMVGMNSLSQALSGFNNAMLMHHQTLQLPVADPLGFPVYREFTEKVRKAIEGNNNLAPTPLFDFLPIRSGNMKIHQLRLIDSFGQIKDLSVSKLIKSETLSHEAFPDSIWLPPRFVPPVRINFRWLSGISDKQEMNTLPNSSPICGWLLANHLDNSVMVYDTQGYAIGSIGAIDKKVLWQSAPGTNIIYQIEDISNQHLRKVVQRLADSNDDFFNDFITTTDIALGNMHAETDIHHQEIALLMGRPIAVVRASLDLQIKDGLPVHHGKDQFIKDLLLETRETNDFEKVKVPVRLGERHKLNDGLVGYWLEDESHALTDPFYSTGIEEGKEKVVQSSNILDIDDHGKTTLQLSLDTKSPTILTMLIDPRGDIHATTGLLPVKAIHIPRAMYAEAYRNINITFLTAPILSGKDQMALPLPKEMGYEWSWLAKERFSWVEIAQTGIVRKDDALKKFEEAHGVWAHLLEKGWLLELDDNRAQVIPTDRRKELVLDEPYSKIADTIEHWLDAGHVVPADTKAAFSGKQIIREGWLKLSPSKP